MQYYVGVDVGGTKVAYGLFDENRSLIARSRTASDSSLSAEQFSDCVIEGIHALLQDANVSISDVQGVGIGMPSFIQFDEGFILMTSNLTNIKNFAAKEYFEQRLHLPVVLDNDANTAALAEHRQGAGRGAKHMLFCPVSTGISNGIIINDALFRGSYGWAGESGHALITPDEGVLCGCENQGCFMSHVSGSMIVKRVQKRLAEGASSILPQLAGGAEQITAETIKLGSDQGDELALWAREHMAYYAGVWLFNLYQIFNINCFVLGGGLLAFGRPWLDRIEQVFWQYNKNPLPVHFKTAELGRDTGIIGAAELVIPRIKEQNHE
ncbi:ROK family protein [Eubacteriales bacterium OttesenSCG-928-N13]|nr:ROK family protein [Eubacteriales bacterium OttesenSCG-928-N13]